MCAHSKHALPAKCAINVLFLVADLIHNVFDFKSRTIKYNMQGLA